MSLKVISLLENIQIPKLPLPSIVVTKGKDFVKKIFDLVMPIFKTGSAMFFCGYGSFEIDLKKFNCKPIRENSNTINKTTFSFKNVHGGFLITTGIFTGIEALHDFAIINLGRFASIVGSIGSSLFIYANLIALEENIRIYEEADHLTNREEVFLQKHSAIWGILSNLGYIIATATAMFAGSVTMALVIGVVACFSGGLKIVMDFLLWIKSE